MRSQQSCDNSQFDCGSADAGRGIPMGAVEHLKTLCCLGLKPESAMIAVTPLLHEIIPHGWLRMGLYESDATMRSAYAENPEMVHYNELAALK